MLEVMKLLNDIKDDKGIRSAGIHMHVYLRGTGMIGGSNIQWIPFLRFLLLTARFFPAERMEVLKTNVAPYASELRLTNFLGWIQLQWKTNHDYEFIAWRDSIKVELEVNLNIFQPPNIDRVYRIQDYILE